jgi:hypothetical protein
LLRFSLTRRARSSSNNRSTIRRSSPRIDLACIAVSRLTMSLLVAEISAIALSTPARPSTGSLGASPITTGSPRLRATPTPRAAGFWSMRTTSNPRSCSPPATRVPTSPPPTTITCPPRGRGSRRIRPVSLAPTMIAVISGSSAIPSAVSRTCATFSGPASAVLVSADPVMSMIPR